MALLISLASVAIKMDCQKVTILQIPFFNMEEIPYLKGYERLLCFMHNLFYSGVIYL